MYQEKNITRKSNLEKKDSLSAYLGMTAQQNHHAFESFYNLLVEVKPKRILEIGTALGGLTEFLKLMSDEMNMNIDILSFDIAGRHNYKKLRQKGIDIRVENIFEQNYTGLKNMFVSDFIKREGVTLVLCDGGNKIKEFNILSKHLKKGDLIMAHDYAYDKETFISEIKLKYWNWHEISESDIEEVSMTQNLIPFMQENFNKAVWVCKIKN
jgi:predicted O-methyltransferase YrrM